MNRLIVMDDVSGVADISKKFANFLTVSRKFGYHCVYMFHVILPSTQICQKIISQTNIFNIFPASIPHNTVSKILQSNCITQTRKYEDLTKKIIMQGEVEKIQNRLAEIKKVDK